MKTKIFSICSLFILVMSSVYSQAIDVTKDFWKEKNNSDIKYFIIGLSIIIIVSALIIFVEIIIGKAIGKKLSKEAGLVLGIVLIILGVTIFIGIPIIIYSNKKKEDLILSSVNINIDSNENEQRINKYEKYLGKNYKDILLENNLSEYIEIFTKNKLTEIEIISDLTDSELENIGITLLGDRKKIMKLFSL